MHLLSLDQEEAENKHVASNRVPKAKTSKVLFPNSPKALDISLRESLKVSYVAENEVNSVSISSIGEKTKDDMSEDSASEEPDFWVPPTGSRWDFDNGKDRWEMSAMEMGNVMLFILVLSFYTSFFLF